LAAAPAAAGRGGSAKALGTPKRRRSELDDQLARTLATMLDEGVKQLIQREGGADGGGDGGGDDGDGGRLQLTSREFRWKEAAFVCRVPRESLAFTRPQANVVTELHALLKKVSEGAKDWAWADGEIAHLVTPPPQQQQQQQPVQLDSVLLHRH
tara:strand:- start:1787 stop:2248 length:462 start_codon:yes stop_codon:yes gene_type:complete